MTKTLATIEMLKPLAWAGLCLLPLVVSLPARAVGDASNGVDVYSAECADCHSLKPGKNKKGPSFAGVVGRAAGSVPGAKYSDAMKSSQIVWSPERIDAYITHPKKVVPGGSMKYDGLDDAKARADVIAFLANKR
jgi:cytochrome c